jgi:hypothetical protein
MPTERQQNAKLVLPPDIVLAHENGHDPSSSHWYDYYRNAKYLPQCSDLIDLNLILTQEALCVTSFFEPRNKEAQERSWFESPGMEGASTRRTIFC